MPAHFYRCKLSKALDVTSRRAAVYIGFFITANFLTGLIVSHYSTYQEPSFYHPVRYVCNASSGYVRRNNHSLKSARFNPHLPTIFVISPTYSRSTQKVDLTSVCNTFMHVPKLVWIVVEDSEYKTELVSSLLDRCQVDSVHLNVRTQEAYRTKFWLLSLFTTRLRGVDQRNAGLHWLRSNYGLNNCSGAVYFGDDDNKYDIRIFDEIRKTKNVSGLMVGFAGGLKYEGPICGEDGRVAKWHSASESSRKVPIDMAGFAVNLKLFLLKPWVKFGITTSGKKSKTGQLETNLLEHFITRDEIECRGSNSEVYAWHTKTADPDLKHEWYMKSSSQVEYR